MASARKILQQLVDVDYFPTPNDAWSKFADWLDSYRGSESLPGPAIVAQLRTEVKRDTLDSNWMREFGQRRDIIQAAEKFAAPSIG